MSVEIKRIFLDVDLRAGENRLAKIAKKRGYDRSQLEIYEVLMFFNRRRNKMRVVARKGMYLESLPKGQTYDFSLRRDQIIRSIGEFLGLEFDVSARVFNRARKEAGIEAPAKAA